MTVLRDRYGITDFPQNVISQWQGSNLQKLVEEMTMQFEDDLFKQLEYLERQTDIDTAEGIWLDFIGFKVGFPRPLTDAANIPQFGFEDADGDPASDPRSLGFDQAPLDTIQEHLIDRAPFGDDLYRKFIKMRLVLLLGNMSVPHIQTAVRQVAPNASVEEREPNAIRINLKGVNSITEEEFKKEPVRSWIKPAGISASIYNIPDGIWLLNNTLEDTSRSIERRQQIFYITRIKNDIDSVHALAATPIGNNDNGIIEIISEGIYEGLAIGDDGVYVIDRLNNNRIIRYTSIHDIIIDEKTIPAGQWLGLAIEDGVIYALDSNYVTTTGNEKYQRIVRYDSWDDVSATLTSDQIKDIPRTFTESGTTKSIEWASISVENGAIYLVDASQIQMARFPSWDSVSTDISDATVKKIQENNAGYQAAAVNNGSIYFMCRKSNTDDYVFKFDSFDDVTDDPDLNILSVLVGVIKKEEPNYSWCGMDVINVNPITYGEIFSNE